MINKTPKIDLGLEFPEKKKKKKKKKLVKEAETDYSALRHDAYFMAMSPRRTTSPPKTTVPGQVAEVPLVKKKKKKKSHTLGEDRLDPEVTLQARRAKKSLSPRKLSPSHLEPLSREEEEEEKKKRKKSLVPLTVAHGLRVKISPDPEQGEEATRLGRKPKKHKKEKKTQELGPFAVQDPWFSEVEDALFRCSVEEQAALTQKRKPESPREHRAKVKKKKKIHQEGDDLLGQCQPARSWENSPRKGSKKKLVLLDAPEYIPIGDGPKVPAKKKSKSKKQLEQQPITEEPAPKKKKKKKRKESEGAGDLCEEEPDTDLEVVLVKLGNTDEAHIDQVRRKALQEEIDRESGKTEASETRTGTQFGQWDTAGFESEEQKLKFLKLMGGFKKPSPSLSQPPSMLGRPNMALSKKAAEKLQQGLQRDYDRAMSWKHSRGAGLGFPTTQDKIFYIDRNASKSVKLDD